MGSAAMASGLFARISARCAGGDLNMSTGARSMKRRTQPLSGGVVVLVEVEVDLEFALASSDKMPAFCCWIAGSH